MQAIIDQIYVDIAGFITCADLPSCQAIIDINAAIAALPAQILAQVYWRAFDWSNEFNVPNGSLVTFQWLDWLRVIADTVNHIISVGLPMAGRTDGAVLTRQGSFAVWSDPLTLSCQQVLSCIQPLLEVIQTQLDNICGTVTNCPIIIDMLNDIDVLQEQVAILNGGWSTAFTCTDVMACSWIIDIQNSLENAYNNSSWDSSIQTITFNQIDWGTDTLVLTWITTDELVKVWAWWIARYLNVNDFSDTSTDIIIKKQMSITSDVAWLKLINDQATPWNNKKYWTNATWVKGRYDDSWVEVSTSVTAQISVTYAHSLNKRANVICLDAAGYEVLPATKLYVDANTVTCTFNPAFTWTIYFN